MRSFAHSRLFVCRFSLFLFVLFLASMVGAALVSRPLPAAETVLFSHSSSLFEAQQYSNRVKRQKPSEVQPLEVWIKRAIIAREANPHSARQSYESALHTYPEKATLWLELAKTIRSIVSANKNRRAMHGFYRDGTGAAYNAFRFAKEREIQAEGLSLLGHFLRSRSYWRPALNAYRASLDLVGNREVDQVYQELRAEKGFRITNYKMNSDLSQPQLCIQFSEQLYARGTDYTTFFKVNNDDPSGVRVEARQICLDGFKHGDTYTVSVRQGLPSVVGEQLLKSTDITVYVRDRSPSVRFSSKAYVLPKFGQRGLPLVSVNTKEAEIQIFKIGDRNILSSVMDGQFGASLNDYQAREIADRSGAEVYKGTIEIASKLNKDVKTAIPVQTALPDMEPGLYVVRAWPKNSKYGSNRGSTQWFIVSDIGLASVRSQNGLYGFVRSITSASPSKGVIVRLIAKNNEVLASLISDEKGMVKFDSTLIAGKGGNQPALMIAETRSGEYGFVDLSKNAFDLTDRGVSGREAPGPLDGFVFAERGVYRPGEEVQLTALLRDQLGDAVSQMPLILAIVRPDGKEHARVSLPDMGAGGRSYSLALISSAMTGTWRVNLYGADKSASIGSTSFLVEDYVPERMELALTKESDVWASRKPAEILVSGVYLYGAPAAKHQLKGDFTITRKTDGLEGYEGYEFGLADERFLNIHKTLDGLALLNERGKSALSLELPEFERPSKPIEARINLRLLEPGGRQVVRAIKLPIANEKPMIGLKRVSSADDMKTSKKAVFEIVSLDKKARKTAEQLRWELVEITKHYQWYNQNGYWRYEPVTYTNRIAQGEVETFDDGPVKIEMPVKRGKYRLEVASRTYNQLAASSEFYVDWYGARDANTPDVLEIAADKPSYGPGDKVEVRVEPKASGRTLLAVMNENIIEMREVEMGPDGGVVTFEVDEKWGVGAYVVAMHYHKLDELEARMPGRAIGVKWIKIDEGPRTLEVSADLPDHHQANKMLKLPITVKGLSAGEKAHVVIAAVDEGILSLTGYKSPRPQAHFYGQRRLASEIRDVYGHLIDGMGGAVGRIRSGGDAAGLQLQGAPNSIKPVALYSGIVEVGEDGKAEVRFEVPQFNGTLRVMSIAWSKTKLGSNEQKLIVRDPVVVLASTPLFLTKGDRSRLFLSIDNIDGHEGLYKIDVSSSTGLAFKEQEMEAPIELMKGKRVNLALTMTAKTIGLATMKLTLKAVNPPEGTSGIEIVQSHDLYIKPAQPNATWRTVKTLAPNGGKLTFGKDIFADIIPETAKATVSVGHLAGLDVAGLFEELNRYAYGCAEQTTSRAMPLLYAAKIAPFYGQSIANDLPKRIEAAVSRLASLQNSQGGFGLWSPGQTDMWLTAYVSDFLTRAQEMKFAVDPQMLTQALERLKNSVNFASDFKRGGEDIAYALYVLARNGQANVGDLRYYADTKIDNFATPIAQAQIAASLAMYGDAQRSQRAFKAAYQSLVEASEEAGTEHYRRDYGTRLRDRAALLALAAEAKNTSLPKIELINTLVEARNEKTYTSTQENAWLLLAANALEDHDKAILLDVNGEDKTGLYRQGFGPDDVKTREMTVTNKSAEEVMAVLTIHGSANNPLPAFEQGLGIKRQFFSLDGKEIALINAKQNDRVVVVVTIEDRGNRGGRLLLTDHIPAGFMIENPKLLTGSNLANFSWLKTRIWPVHQSFRDDKFVAAFNLSTGRRNDAARVVRVAYIMRAAHDGRFIHPAAHVEDMYRPNRYAQTGAQNVIIEKP